MGDPVKVYPAIIDEDQWSRINEPKAAAMAAAQGRGRAISNLLGKLAKCRKCGGTMQPLGSSRWVARKNGQKTQHYFLYCQTAKMSRGVQCDNQRGWPYSKVETPLIDKILTLALDDQHFESNDATVAALSRKLAAAQRVVTRLQQRRIRILKLAGDREPDEMERAEYEHLRVDEKEATRDVDRLASEVAAARGSTSPAEHIVRVGEVRDRMMSEDIDERYTARLLVKAALAELVDSIMFDPDTGKVAVSLAKGFGQLFIRANGETSFFNLLHPGRDFPAGRDSSEVDLIAAYGRRVSRGPLGVE